ncbi:MAG TPA: sugar nucleotide-binding protein, partial [Planctomycetota bacterium]|nr:sugar nucleotide-binding protein [Planctomycetota bacterium]
MPAFRVLVTGGNGFLGPFVVAALQRRGAEAVTVARSGGDVRIDLTQAGPRRELLAAIAPSAVLHLAARSRLAECEQDPAAARAVNARLSGELAAEFGNRLLYVSTDLVFDGRAAPYGEHAAPGPLSVYGSSKAEGEELVRAHGGRIVRLPLLFGA